ncbi:MAG: hypothetical protein ACR2N9_12635 [Acidimicrobiia bacterium]
MDIRLDHLYRETHHWTTSVEFWERLGFTFESQWGAEPHRAGTLVRGSASIVLAEVGADSEPQATVFLATDDLDGLVGLASVEAVDTHWGTRMVALTDPDGRIYNFEPGEAS